MSLASRLKAVLGLDHSQFSRGLKGAEREAQGFGARMKGVGGQLSAALGVGIPTVTAAATIGFLRNTVRGIAEVGDEAKKSGLGMRAFQEWKFVAEQNRIGVDALVDGFKELSLRADEFIITGGGSASDAFKRLGLSATDLKTKLKDPSALMLEIIGRLQGFDRAARIRITDEIFGGAGGEQLLQILGKSETELREMIARGHELGAVLDDQVIAKADELDRKFAEVATRLGNLMKTAVVGGVEYAEVFAKFRAENEGLFRGLEAAFPQLAAVGLAVDGLGVTVGETADAIKRDLDASMADMGVEAQSLAGHLMGLSQQLAFVGEVDAGAGIAAMAQEMMDLSNRFKDGKIEGAAFQVELAELNQRAITAVTELGNINGVRMGKVVDQVGLVTAAIGKAIELARAWRAAMPGSAPAAGSDGEAPPASEWQEVAPPSGVGARPPPRAPNDHWWLPTTDSSSKGGGGGGGAKQDDYARELERTRERISQWEAETVVLASVASGSRQLGDAMEFARKKADLLTAAKKAGKAITPELEAEIEKLAEAYMTAGLNAEQAADRLEQIKGASERGIDAMSTLFGAVLQGSDAAKQAVAGLIAEIARVQLRKTLLSGGGGGGFFGWLGGLIGSNSMGTGNWVGGLTRVNELGGEILDLPKGSRVIPADVSRRMADRAADGGSAAIRIELGEGLVGSILEQSGAQTVQLLQANNKTLPGAIQQFRSNPRRR